MSRTPRSVWDAVNAHRTAPNSPALPHTATDDSSTGGGEASHGDAPPSAATSPIDALNMFANMQFVIAHQHQTGIVLELCPLGHMSRRWLYIDGVTAVTDVSDGQHTAIYRNRRGPTDDQAQIDIGDDMFEREREDRP